ncbi:MAG: V-type ATPase subunit [Syntrophaceae bacterium]|nr:V-type ATPase subunit [Syntrophaceae bacterium]
MRDYADAANIHARIYAMRSRLLSMKDYVSLVRDQKESLYNNNADASEPVESEENVFRDQIAKIFPLAEAYRAYTPLFLAFFQQFEALNAKLILAKAFNLQSLELWYDIGPYAILNQSLLREKANLHNIRLLLTGTYLEDVFEDMTSFEQMESRVDLCAARNLYAASALFTRKAKRDFQELLGRKIAVSAMILSLRLKKTYKWDDEKINSFLERFHDAFGGAVRPQIKIVEKALDRHLEQLRASGAQEPSVVDIDHYLEQYYYNWISSVFHRDFHSISCVVAYLWLLFYQIRNLLRIIEGKRFGFSPELIIGRIVCN